MGFGFRVWGLVQHSYVSGMSKITIRQTGILLYVAHTSVEYRLFQCIVVCCRMRYGMSNYAEVVQYEFLCCMLHWVSVVADGMVASRCSDVGGSLLGF